MAQSLTISDLRRGMLVEWEWSDPAAIQLAKTGTLRSLGRVVTADDLPNMRVDGEYGIQALDNPAWVIDPVQMIQKGRSLFAVEAPDT